MVLRSAKFIPLFLLAAGCVERYNFVVMNNEPSLVIEGFISDKSFDETLLYPSDGRYFTVKLSWTGDVTNRRAEPVSGASVQLLSSNGSEWTYTEDKTGFFRLGDKSFKALPAVQYKLRISLGEDEGVYESAWEGLPHEIPTMGDIGFSETEQQMYVMEAGQWNVRTFRGVMTHVGVPENSTQETIRYRWTYSPTWIYRAPLSSVIDPGHLCWATDLNYLNTYALQIDRSGGYKKDLFFFRTIRNERIFERLSVLVTQHALTEPYFAFWKEMKEQNEGSNLSDLPPYNLKTNYYATAGDKRVSGYFGVVREQAKRWWFSRKDLSYNVINTLKADCLVDYGGPPAPECLDCREYSFGIATTTKPVWWK